MARPLGNSARRGSRVAGVLALGTVLIAVITASLGGYLVSRSYTEPRSVEFGPGLDEPDSVDLMVWVTRVDVVGQKMAVNVTNFEPRGSYASDDGRFAVDVVFETNSLNNASTAISAGELLPTLEQNFALAGVVTDFPFDRYTSLPSFRMTGPDGEEVPLTLTVQDTDAFFSISAYLDPLQTDWVNVDFDVERTLPTVVFGVFIMVLMLGLAAAAVVLAYYVTRYRQGMQYSAYSVMAGLLFAMIPLRNAIPGNPPIGSVLDFMAFFIAEAVISVSLITSVVMAYRHQRAIDAQT